MIGIGNGERRGISENGWMLLRSYFFFQAEDGIRDDLVTGVQTCALPISGQETGVLIYASFRWPNEAVAGGALCYYRSQRSEERRVGKECGSVRKLNAS